MARAAIIVVGGAASRMGGVPKPWLHVGGRPIIEHVVRAARLHVRDVVLVGLQPDGARPIRDVVWTIETPRGAGPAAGVRAGMAVLAADVDEVLLLAGDAPFIASALNALMAQPLSGDGIAVEAGGVTQFLLARLRRAPLQRALDVGGASMRSVFDHLQISLVRSDVQDADTWEDVARIRQEIGAVVADRAWLDEVSAMLSIDPTLDVDAVLALARDVAHSLERKNAPLTSYLLGYAAASRGLTPAEIARLATEIGQRAREHRNDG